MELALQVCFANQQGLLTRETDVPSCVRYAASCPGSGENSPRDSDPRTRAKEIRKYEITVAIGNSIQEVVSTSVSSCRGPATGRACLRSSEFPLGERSQRLDASIHQHHRTRPFSRRNRGFRVDLRVWRRGIEESPGGSAVRRRHGHRRSELHGLALSVTQVSRTAF